jgi:hypothetical protein
MAEEMSEMYILICSQPPKRKWSTGEKECQGKRAEICKFEMLSQLLGR